MVPVELQIATLDSLQSSHRYTIALRSFSSNDHQTILIYRSPAPAGTPLTHQRWWSIVNACPHLGLPLEGGDIEDLCPSDDEDADDGTDGEGKEKGDAPEGPIIMCPHHAYDFDLSTGASSTGSKACTFKMRVRDDGCLWMESPGTVEEDWRVVGIRAVSERTLFSSSSPCPFFSLRPSFSSLPFLYPPPSQPLRVPPSSANAPHFVGFADSPADDALSSPLASRSLSSSPQIEPNTIVSFCRLILLAPSPSQKVTLVQRLCTLFRSGALTRLADPLNDPPHPEQPYRAPEMKLVEPGKATRLGKGGSVQSRVKMLHSLATIEQWAIDLAVDHIGRFWDWRKGDEEGQKGKRMGWEFVSDFLKVAEDEAKCVFYLLTLFVSLRLTTPIQALHPPRLSSLRPWHSLRLPSRPFRSLGVGNDNVPLALLPSGNHCSRSRGPWTRHKPRLHPTS